LIRVAAYAGPFIVPSQRQPRREGFLQRLHDDAGFRAAFAADPAAVLRAHGFDPDLLELPAKIDPVALEQRIAQGGVLARPSASEVAQKSAQQLWDDHHFIRLNKDDPIANVVVTVNGPTVTALVYGTTAVNVAQIGVTGSAPLASLADLGRLSDLRKLARLAPDQLTFGIDDGKGTAAMELSHAALTAFLQQHARTRKGTQPG